MNIADLIIIVFIAIVAVFSARKGFLMSLFNLASYFISAVLVKIFSPSVSEYIYTSFVSEKIRAEITQLLPSEIADKSLSQIADDILSVVPESVAAVAKQFGLYPDTAALAQVGTNEPITAEMLEQRFIQPIITGVISVIVMLALFILFVIVLRIVFHIINGFLTKKKHTLIRQTNMFFGAALGVVKGAVISALICFILNIASPVINNAVLMDMTTGSYFCNLIADIIK